MENHEKLIEHRASIHGPAMYRLLKDLIQNCDLNAPESWDPFTIQALAFVRVIERRAENEDNK